MKVLITAINSFIGRNLGDYLSNLGHEVFGTLRPSSIGKVELPYIRGVFPFDLKNEFNIPSLKSFDILIHAAHDFTKGTYDINLKGTKRLARKAKQEGIKRQIFFSSYSACFDAVTEYGQTKFALENFFREINEVCIRPGMVIGQGGIFQKITKIINLSPLIPILDGKKGKVPFISIHQLNEAINCLMTIQNPKPIYNLFINELIPLKELIQMILKAQHKRRFLLSIPSRALVIPLNILDKLNLNFLIDINNVKAFIHNQTTKYSSNLKELLNEKQNSLQEIIQEAFA